MKPGLLNSSYIPQNRGLIHVSYSSYKLVNESDKFLFTELE